jgi:ligand-binding sensor domain-containing protein
LKFSTPILISNKEKDHLLVLIGIILFSIFFSFSFGQYPNYFSYNDEKGLPTNEVYSLSLGKNGFLWIGGDAGLFRFNGVRYQSFKCKEQKSRSITGLTLSTTGSIFCYNFIGQIFVQKNDSLYCLNREFKTINNIAADKKGNIYVTYFGGLAVYNEQKNQWKDLIKSPNSQEISNKYSTKCSGVNQKGELIFVNSRGVNKIRNSNINTYKSSIFKTLLPSYLLLAFHKNDLFLLSIDKYAFYKFSNNRLLEIKSPNLLKALEGRKLTKVKSLNDGMLWICTYNGIIRYDTENDKVNIYYPDLGFSDCLIDTEGNYWFSTLQAGLMRIKNLDQIVWNNENRSFDNDRISKLVYDGQNLFFSNVIGRIGKLNLESNNLGFYETGNKADVQSLDFDAIHNSILFNQNNIIYTIKDNKLKKSDIVFPAVKTICRVDLSLFLGSSSNLSILEKNKLELLKIAWVRSIKYDDVGLNLWVACNDGLLLYKKDVDSNWQLVETFLKNQQLLSLAPMKGNSEAYALNFEGLIYKVSVNGKVELIAKLPSNLLAKKIQVHDSQIFTATNNGVHIYNLETKKWRILSKFSGLASNNIQDLLIIDDYMWLATGKGLQKYPILEKLKTPLAKVYLSKLLVDNKLLRKSSKRIQIYYGQLLELFPEVVSFSSQGNFKLAYRMKGGKWNEFPANIGKISIPNIPSGEFEIEVVAFDYLGRKSANSIKISGWVYPPIWERTWFYLLAALIFIFIVFGISRYLINNIRKKALLETELSNLKLTAIKAQMNPHFIFNALNSIQDLILKGDVENSYSYIITFSNLVRKTLEYSGKTLVDFDQEIELLKLYLSLENLRFKNELQTELIVPEIENVSIPPMLIQPFIENALIHGLLHKDGTKKLRIEFQLNEQLICIIEDNGVGREQSKIIKNRRGVNHASFSGDAIQKRFEILNKASDYKFGFEYEDLWENNQATGTRVKIIIPFKPLY